MITFGKNCIECGCYVSNLLDDCPSCRYSKKKVWSSDNEIEKANKNFVKLNKRLEALSIDATIDKKYCGCCTISELYSMATPKEGNIFYTTDTNDVYIWLNKAWLKLCENILVDITTMAETINVFDTAGRLIYF